MIWVMTLKDLKRMLRDRKALMITILMPAILTAILGFAIGGMFNSEIQLDTAQVAVVSNANVDDDMERMNSIFDSEFMQLGLEEDKVKQMTEQLTKLNFEEIFLEDVLESESMEEIIEYKKMSELEAQKLLDDGTITAMIIIPEQFHYNMWLSFFTPFRNDVEIEIRKGTEHELKAGIVEMIVSGYTDHLSVGVIGKQVLLEKASEFNVATEVNDQLGTFMEKLMQMELNETVIDKSSVEGKNTITSFHYYAAGMGVMFMLFSAGYVASYTVNERFLLTFDRMKIAGISLRSILSGKFLSCTIFTILQLLLLILFSTILFQISWGNLLVVLLITVVASIGVGSLAVFISIINLQASNDRASNVFQSAIIPLMALVGGSFVPNTALPSILKTLGDHTLNGATLNSYLMAIQGYSLADVQVHILVLVIYSVFFLSLAGIAAKLKEV